VRGRAFAIIITLFEGQPSHITRRYDQAQTPFDRLCATGALSDAQRQELQALRDRTNPLFLSFTGNHRRGTGLGEIAGSKV
jgi:hypothetical protein